MALSGRHRLWRYPLLAALLVTGCGGPRSRPSDQGGADSNLRRGDGVSPRSDLGIDGSRPDSSLSRKDASRPDGRRPDVSSSDLSAPPDQRTPLADSAPK